MLAITLFFLSSCNISVEDLIIAPSLTADQNAILTIIQQENTERVMLKYPVSGDWRTPIQFFDLDSDGVDEALVFYSVSPEVNARIAILAVVDDEWVMSSEYQGDGPEVNSVELLPGNDASILVEWGSVNPNNKQLVVYSYLDRELRIGFTEECSDILKGDFNNDGTLEFYYISRERTGERFLLKYAADTGGGYSIVSEIQLHAEMAALLALKIMRNSTGQQLVYVDESIERAAAATEVFTLGSSGLTHAVAEKDFDIFLLSIRQPEMVCRVFSNISSNLMMIPSRASPRETIADETLWNYWYYVQGESLKYYFATFVNIPLNLNVVIPDSWLENTVVSESEQEMRLFVFADVFTGEAVFEIKVLRVEEDQQKYEDLGFKPIQRPGGDAYRYLYRAGESCSVWDERYITEHFYSVTN